jgi:hypothetical protein
MINDQLQFAVSLGYDSDKDGLLLGGPGSGPRNKEGGTGALYNKTPGESKPVKASKDWQARYDKLITYQYKDPSKAPKLHPSKDPYLEEPTSGSDWIDPNYTFMGGTFDKKKYSEAAAEARFAPDDATMQMHIAKAKEHEKMYGTGLSHAIDVGYLVLGGPGSGPRNKEGGKGPGASYNNAANEAKEASIAASQGKDAAKHEIAANAHDQAEYWSPGPQSGEFHNRKAEQHRKMAAKLTDKGPAPSLKHPNDTNTGDTFDKEKYQKAADEAESLSMNADDDSDTGTEDAGDSHRDAADAHRYASRFAPDEKTKQMHQDQSAAHIKAAEAHYHGGLAHAMMLGYDSDKDGLSLGGPGSGPRKGQKRDVVAQQHNADWAQGAYDAADSLSVGGDKSAPAADLSASANNAVQYNALKRAATAATDKARQTGLGVDHINAASAHRDAATVGNKAQRGEHLTQVDYHVNQSKKKRKGGKPLKW